VNGKKPAMCEKKVYFANTIDIARVAQTDWQAKKSHNLFIKALK